MVKRPYLSLRHPLLPLPSLNADPIHDWTTASPVGRPGGLEAGKMVEKTSRQSYSCAECKRLKLKCSRVWPCTSCEKRGCAQICPNGEMKTGKGRRLILADTEELHQRIALLEVALAQSHSKTSTSAHPLLSSPYLFSAREPLPDRGGLDTVEEEEDTMDSSFGTLTIGTDGEARFIGSHAGSEYLRDGETRGGSDTPLNTTGSATPAADVHGQGLLRNDLEHDENGPGLLDLIVPGGSPMTDVEALQAELPDWDIEGRGLIESYWENVNWMYQILPRPMFDNDHLLNAYDAESPPNAHKLACVFLVMAIGAMFDLDREPFHPRGHTLYCLGRACLRSVSLERASPATVQALHLCGTYILNDKRGSGGELFWPILGTAVKIAQSLGLHRDGAPFDLSTYEVEERRQVWWELIAHDRSQALCFGRPCATSNRSSDTQYPETGDLFADKDGYHHAKYRLIEMMERVIDVQTQITPVPLSVVTLLDTELQEFKKNLPESLLPDVAIKDLPLDRILHPHLIIHRFTIRLLVAQTRLLLNRPSFTRALTDKTEDPSSSKFGVSFVALYESAQEIVQLVKHLVIYHPSLIARWWFFWFHAFSSAVCLSAIVIKAPDSAFASPAFSGMSTVCDIAVAAHRGCRAKKGLPILIRLRIRAKTSLAAANHPHANSANTIDSPSTIDDLSHLVSTAKLHRVAHPITPRRVAVEPVVIRPGDTPPSPKSQGSFATSTTFADPFAYDPFTGLIMEQPDLSRLDLSQYDFAGIVPPPPPPLPAPGEMWYTLDATQDFPQYPMAENLTGNEESIDVTQMIGLGDDFEGETGMDLVQWSEEPDAMDQDFGFDFEAFVNQAGMGELME